MIRSAGILLALFFLSAPGHAQLNPYKYVVIPTHFENFRKPNQYQTSTLIKFLFTENGYPAVYDKQEPTELKIQPCLGAYARLNDTSGMFVTRVKLEFVDCEGKQVFETYEGSSRLKDYLEAYREAIREAFRSFSGRPYSYQPSASQPAIAAPALQAAAVPAAAAAPVGNPPAEEPETESVAAPEVEIAVVEPRQEPVAGAVAAPVAPQPETWYAQPLADGYQLVDSTPKIRMKLVNTSREDTYIALVDGQARGTVFLSDGIWVHEYFEGGTLHRQALSIKF